MRSTNLVSAKNQYEANSFASGASTLASSTGTPWAAYDAGFSAAQAANVTAVSNAAKTNAIAQATAQKTAEVAKTRGLSLGFVFDQRPKFTAKARSSPSLGARQEAPGADQPVLNGKNAGSVPEFCLASSS
jgi:hypothetical protein